MTEPVFNAMNEGLQEALAVAKVGTVDDIDTLIERVSEAAQKFAKKGTNPGWQEYHIKLVGAKSALRAAIKRNEPAGLKDIDTGRFDEWTDNDFAAQCRMQAKEQLDPEFSAFMAALSKRISALSKAKEG